MVAFAQLQQAADALSHVLVSLGVQRGDRVTIYLPMVPEAAVAMLAGAVQAGVRISAVDIMTMDYGAASSDAPDEGSAPAPAGSTARISLSVEHAASQLAGRHASGLRQVDQLTLEPRRKCPVRLAERRTALAVSDLSPEQKQQLRLNAGIMVVDVRPGGRVDLRPGDVILAVVAQGDAQDVRSVQQFNQLMNQLRQPGAGSGWNNPGGWRGSSLDNFYYGNGSTGD